MCTTGGAACMKPATQRAPLMVFSSISRQPLVRCRETDQPATSHLRSDSLSYNYAAKPTL